MENNIVEKILKNNNIQHSIITRSKSGFTNEVYFIDDNYVIKISKDIINKKKLVNEITIYKNLNLPFMPNYITSGTYKEYKYLIITKLKGKSLYSIWHTLSNQERAKIVVEIANIVKLFHQANSHFLTGYNNVTFKEYIREELLIIIEKLEKLKLNTSSLQNILNNYFDKLFCNIKTGLVYNDLHFDNLIYDKEKLYLIDFDRTLITSLDYEMMIFKTMCDNPSKFANEEVEGSIVEAEYKNIYNTFKKSYPELFLNEYTDFRIFIYQFIYLISQAIKCNDKNRIIQELQKFNLFFNNKL